MYTASARKTRGIALFAAVLALVLLLPGAAGAHPDATGDPAHDHDLDHERKTSFPRDPDAALQQQDEEADDVVSTGPSARRGRVKNLELVGRGERLVPKATTDVWVHDSFAYLGTFNEPCGTGEGYVAGVGDVDLVQNVAAPGIAVFDVHNANRPAYIGTIPSVAGSRINDVKVESLGERDILVHSNEPCAGGPGGFEIYDVSDPRNPVHLARVTTGDVNPTVVELFGTDDVGVHNLYLFSRGGRDFVAVQVEGLLANFQIFDITDPTSPELVTTWGAEELFDPSVDWSTTEDVDLILEVWRTWLAAGFGASQNRYLHDFWVADDGTLAYLANWDAGLVRLDLTDLANPQVVSVALDPTSEDGEVNSHSVWPSEDGRVVVEGEEDFAPFKLQLFVAEGLVGIFDAAEARFTPSIADLPDRTFGGDAVYVGLACDTSEPVPAGDGDDIAVVMRGACRFDEKVQNIQDAGGYEGVVIFNAPGDESLLSPSGAPRDLPTIFVAHSSGLAIFGVEDADELEIGMRGEPVRGEAVPDGWSGFRIWDYSDPANPVLASTFNTVCSANPIDASCDPRGVYSSHNVIVENQGNRILAYFSWYANGVIVADVTDPYNPVEIARYNPTGDAFEEQNAGIQDVWGIYKEQNRPWIYASDRNGGLYVLKLLGAGSSNRNAGSNDRGAGRR